MTDHGTTARRSRMTQVQRALKPILESAGFLRTGRRYDRLTASGVTHRIEFQMGVRQLTGFFAVNLGVHVTADVAFGTRLKRRPGEWWRLSEHLDRRVWAVRRRLRDQAFPWFNQFRSREQIIGHWRMHGALPGHPPDYSTVLVAILMHESGRRDDAAWLLRRAHENVLHENPRNDGFAAVAVAAKLGITL